MATETYSAEDYRRELEMVRDFLNPTIVSALAIAARVMEPGVIEDTIFGDVHPNEIDLVAKDIRAALTGGSNGN